MASGNASKLQIPPVSLESLEHPQSPGACTTAEVSGSSPPSHTTDIDHRNYPHSDARLLDATCATDTPYYSYPDVMEGDIDDIISTSTRDHTPSAEPQSATIDFNNISPSTRDHTPCAEMQLATIDFEPHLFMEGHFEDIISTSARDHTPCADPPATIDLHSPLPGGANRDTVRRCSYGCQDERLLHYDAVHATKLPNFTQCRTPLPSPLNKWRYYLSDYNDNIVCDFMEFGWPIGYMSPALPHSILQNHASSLAYPAHVDHFIDTELRHGALIGPFPQAHPPFTHVATSPLMSRPKKNSEQRRIIMNFSFPIGHAVNSGIPKDTYLGLPYKLHYPTIDDYVRLILNHGPGCFLYKADLARAFRMLPADPLDYPLLGLFWNDQLYIDTAIGFGLRTGSMACQRVTNAIGYIMGTFYGATTLQYVDDCLGVEADESTASAAYGNLRNVVAELGLQEAPDKLCTPSPRMEFIGVTFDTVTGTISIPGEKMKEIMALVRDWQGRTSATKHQLQSLLGKLHHVAKCVKPARLFVSRMLDTLRSFYVGWQFSTWFAVVCQFLAIIQRQKSDGIRWNRHLRSMFGSWRLPHGGWRRFWTWILPCFHPFGHTPVSISYNAPGIPQYSYSCKSVEASLHRSPCARELWQHGFRIHTKLWSLKGQVFIETCPWNLATGCYARLQHICRACVLPGQCPRWCPEQGRGQFQAPWPICKHVWFRAVYTSWCRSLYV